MKQSIRRRLVGAAAVVVGISVLPACSPGGGASGSEDEIVVLGFGGAYDAVLKANAAEFEEETGVKVTILPSGGADTLLKARAKEADVVVTDPIWAFRGEEEGLWEKLEGENVEALYDVARLSDYSVAHDFGAYGIAYNPDEVESAPTSWTDLWDPEYCGHVGVRSFKPDSIELMVLMAKLNGGSERDIDPGLAKMAELSKCVHSWVDEDTQELQLFRSGELSLATWTDARTAWAKTEGADVEFVMPEEGAFPLVSVMNVVKGRPNTDIALDYLNFELSEQSQDRMATDLGYFPANSNVELAPDVQSEMAFTPENIESLQMADWRYVVTALDEWETRWETEVVAQ